MDNMILIHALRVSHLLKCFLSCFRSIRKHERYFIWRVVLRLMLSIMIMC